MKMLKNYKISLLTLAVGISMGLSSCHKNLFEDPITSLSPGAAFSTKERVEKSAIGMYDQLQNKEFFGGRVLIYTDIRGIDANPNDFFGPMYQFNTLTAGEATTGLAYGGGYRTIGEVNLFLKNMAAAGNIVPADKVAQYTGEAKFIRSLCYFYLVNLWAQPYKFTAGATHLGVPLVLTSSDVPFDPSNLIPRNTVGQVYAQLESDLLDAEAKLPSDYGDPAFQDVTRATKGAAQALLARLYLYKGDYVKANAYADKVIASPRAYALSAAPNIPFRTFNTPESIFSVGMSAGDNPNTNNAIAQHYASNLRHDITVSSEYLGLSNKSVDLRYTTLTTVLKGSTYTTKYQGVGDWIPVLRYAEIVLIKAEALANISAGVDGTAVTLLNSIRARAHATILAPASKAELIDNILTERRIELAFEGHGIFDFLRTGRGVPAHSNIKAQPYGSDYVVLPIPRHDTDINPNLTQNPGY